VGRNGSFQNRPRQNCSTQKTLFFTIPYWEKSVHPFFSIFRKKIMKKEDRSIGVYTDNLTIVLPIKDRVAFTFRWLRFASEIEIACPIIIADGGHNDQIARKLEAGNPYQKLNLTYIRYPPCNSTNTYNTRIYNTLQKVKTPLVVLGADDDFLFPSGMESTTRFLMDNPDYSSARGDSYNFSVKSLNPHGKFNVYGKLTSVREFPYLDLPKDSEQEDTINRLALYYKALSMTMWCDIQRTENVKKNWATILKYPIIDLWFSQYLLDSLTFLQGKNANMPGLFSMKQGNPGTSDGADRSDFKNFIDKIFSSSWHEQMDIFLDVIAPIAAKQSVTSESDTKEKLRLAFLHGVIKPRIVQECLKNREFGRYLYAVPTRLTGKVGYKNNIFWRIEDIVERSRLLNQRILNRLNSYNIFNWKSFPGVLPVGSHRSEMKWLRKFLLEEQDDNFV
jgi:glycosyltransferase domain-containing protein